MKLHGVQTQLTNQESSQMMPFMRATAVAAAFAIMLTGCKGETQTDRPVTTDGPGTAASTSASGDSADKVGMAMVRVVNAAPESQGLVIRTDEAHALPPADFKKITPYLMIDKTWATFQVRGTPASNYEPLETNRELLTDGHRYSVIVMRDDKGQAFRTRVVRDDISDDMTTAHVRVIHAAAGIDEVNVIAKGAEKLFDGVNFTSEEGFKDVAPWSGSLEIRTESGNRLLGTIPNVELKAGKSVTIVLTRDRSGKLDSFWFEDSQT
jgi:Domain of unknown function (DUF4397)